MDEGNNNQPGAPKSHWVKPEKGAPELYCNVMHETWTLFDVRLAIGLMVPVVIGNPAAGFEVREQGALTMSWPQTKALRDVLIGLISSYEEVNGEIKPINLAPPLREENKQQTPPTSTMVQ